MNIEIKMYGHTMNAVFSKENLKKFYLPIKNEIITKKSG